MRRLGVALATFLMATLLLQGNASAWRDIEWCAEDPVFTLLDATFSVTTNVHAPAADVSQIAYVVDVPENAGEVKVRYPGGRPVPTTVQIRYTLPAAGDDDSFGVTVHVTVTSSRETDTRIELTGRSVTAQTFTGATNTTTSFAFTVTPK